MAESAALLVDEVLPHEPILQWVLSFPVQLRFLFASRPELMGKALGIRSGPRFSDNALRSYFPRYQAASGSLMDS